MGQRLSGRLYQAQGRHHEAIAAFEKALELEPGAIAPLTGIVVSYLAQDKPEEAQAYLEGVIAKTPENPVAHNLLGEVLVREKNPDAAAGSFRRSIELRKDWPVPYANLGRVLTLDGKTQEAITVYRQALAEFPNNQGLMLALAEAQQRADDYQGAMATYEQVLEKYPDSEVAVNNLAALIADYRTDDEASLKRGLDLAKRFETSDNPFYLDTLGWLYYRLGELDQARIYLARAAELRADIPQLQFHLGLVLHRLGETDLARAALEKATPEGAQYPGIEQAQAILKNM
jgi:tetratricopeptide (TPR) repeat protein